MARKGERRVTYRVLVGRLEGKRPLRRPRRRCEDNTKVHLPVIELGSGLNLSSSERDRCWAVVDTVMELRVP